jgi:SAM-dependent methyltransferase
LIENEKKFDLVILQNALEHAPNPEELLSNLNKIISDRGCMFLQVPNDYSPMQMLAMNQKRIDREHWFAPPQHLSFFNMETLRSLLDDMGFEVLDFFADFPIEIFLWGGEKNYTQDKSLGRYAHQARISLDLLFSETGMENYIDFYRAACRVGFCRNMIVLARPVGK